MMTRTTATIAAAVLLPLLFGSGCHAVEDSGEQPLDMGVDPGDVGDNTPASGARAGVVRFTRSEDRRTTRPVDLGVAGRFAVLAKSEISTVPESAIRGHVGISPAAASFITGFSLTADASNRFSTSTQVEGMVFAADYAPPTPTALTTAVGDMELAFTDAAGRAPNVSELGAGDIGGMTLTAGVYKWGTGLLVPTDLTLTGDGDDVWIFQIAQDLTVSSGVQVHLSGGALPRNVFWQVSGGVDIGSTAHWEGIVLSMTAINLRTGASSRGRLLAQTAVTLDSNIVTQPN